MKEVNKTFNSDYPFYNSYLGRIVAEALGRLLKNVWQEELRAPLKTFAVIGEGDFLIPFLAKKTTFIPKSKIKGGVIPFKEGSFTNVIVFDGLSNKQDEKTFARELARIMTDDGKVLFIAARKSSFWTYDASIPYKDSVQYQPSSLSHLLRDNMLTPVKSGRALLIPPALYNLKIAEKEQKFVPFFGFLSGIIAISAIKTAFVPPSLSTPVYARTLKKFLYPTN